MEVNFAELRFSFPSLIVLTGPMAAAKPLFAQKLTVALLNEKSDIKAMYFATSSPVCGILRNLKMFGLEEEKKDKITFFDYNPACDRIEKVGEKYYLGNFSKKEQLKRALSHADEKTIVVVPSFTLLLVGTEDKMGLTDVLIEGLRNQGLASFVAVNSTMFAETNKAIEDRADDVLSFTREGKKVHIKVIKSKRESPGRQVPFEFPIEMFQSTKKEVAERASRIIGEKKRG